MTNDELLIQEVLEGDRDRFGTLVEPYIDRLHAISYSYLGNAHAAEDVTQDALIKAFTSLRTLADPGEFGPWLRQITRNLSLSAVRRRKFETIDPNDHRDTEDSSAEQPGNQARARSFTPDFFPKKIYNARKGRRILTIVIYAMIAIIAVTTVYHFILAP